MKLLGKITIALAASLAIAAPAAMAQGRKSLRINEVMVVNDSSVVDDYGTRSAWIELYNPTAAAVNIASVYLTDNLENPTLYHVPTGDNATKIGKGQTALFFADGKPNHGTFHLSFTLKPGQDNFIAVFDADGKSLIDSVTVPASLPAGQSLARAHDGTGEWQVRTDSSHEDAITPGGRNEIPKPNQKIKNFKEMDENGFAMSGMAMTIVFSALLVLCLCFLFLVKVITSGKKAAKNPAAPAGTDVTLTPAPQSQGSADGEVAAAIAMALHQHLNMHDDLPTRLTIRHNTASAWSSKAAAMRQTPVR